MTKRLHTSVMTCFIVLAVFVSPAAAHYLWDTIDAKSGEHGVANIYFEGGPSAGDGQYLDTDASGRAQFEAKEEGRYTFRTSVDEKKEGTDNRESYQLIRHHGTLIMNLPL